MVQGVTSTGPSKGLSPLCQKWQCASRRLVSLLVFAHWLSWICWGSLLHFSKCLFALCMQMRIVIITRTLQALGPTYHHGGQDAHGFGAGGLHIQRSPRPASCAASPHPRVFSGFGGLARSCGAVLSVAPSYCANRKSGSAEARPPLTPSTALVSRARGRYASPLLAVLHATLSALVLLVHQIGLAHVIEQASNG